MAQPVLSVRDLRVEFPTPRGILTAVDDVSFAIHAGEVLGVVGESGAGKSMAAAALIGLLPASARLSGGEVWLEGQRIDALPPKAMRKIRGKRIGMVFQDPQATLNPFFTIGQHLVETLQTHFALSAAAARMRAIALLAEVGVQAPQIRIDAYPHTLSGGLRQRVAIALALSAQPDLVIADEPTSALDVAVQAQIIALLKRLCRERGTAVLLISHDMGVIADAADRVAVMYAGRVVEIAAVEAIVRRPRHPYTQGLMGAIPKLSRPAVRLTHIPGAMPPLTALPPGCAFHPRCPQALSACRTGRPALAGGPVAQVACWLQDGEIRAGAA